MSNSNTSLKMVTTAQKSVYQVFCDQHASGSVKGKFRIARKEDKKIVLCSKEDLVNLTGGTFVKYGTKNMNITKAWGLDPNRKKFNNGAWFNPVAGRMQSDDLDIDGKGRLNLYGGMATRAIQGDCSLILQHIKEVWCGDKDDVNDYVLNWFARMIQIPQKVASTALALCGEQGAGKNVITDIFDRAFGHHGVTFSRGDQLTGRFNAQLASSVFVCADEATWGGSKSEEGFYKAVITNDTFMMEQKGLEQFEAANCVHLVTLTNNDWSVPQGLDDRRFVSLDVISKYKNNLTYFSALRNQINNGGAEAFIHFLMNRDISNFKPQDRPNHKTTTAYNNKLQSADSTIQWIAECISFKTIENNYGVLVSNDKMQKYCIGATGISCDAHYWGNEVVIPKKDLYGAYVGWCQKNRNQHVKPNNIFAKDMKKLGTGTTKHKINGSPIPCYKLLPIDAMEEKLKKLLGG